MAVVSAGAPCSAGGDRQWESFRSGPWEGRTRFAADGAADTCEIASRQSAPYTLTFVLDQADRLFVRVSNRYLALEPGQYRQTRIAIDRTVLFVVDAEPQTPSSFLARLPSTRGTMALLREGRRLVIKVPRGIRAFDLTGSRAAIDRLAECADYWAARSASAEASSAQDEEAAATTEALGAGAQDVLTGSLEFVPLSRPSVDTVHDLPIVTVMGAGVFAVAPEEAPAEPEDSVGFSGRALARSAATASNDEELRAALMALGLEEGMAYSDVRKRLFAAGWQGVHKTIAPEGGQGRRLFESSGFDEIDGCSGAALAHCWFLFRDATGNGLMVQTYGSDEPCMLHAWAFVAARRE